MAGTNFATEKERRKNYLGGFLGWFAAVLLYYSGASSVTEQLSISGVMQVWGAPFSRLERSCVVCVVDSFHHSVGCIL